MLIRSSRALGARRAAVLLLAVALVLGAALAPASAQEPPRLSQFGVYSGYSAPEYDGWVRTSRYLTMRDGTRIALDINRPTRGGILHEEPLPIIFIHERYHRASLVAGQPVTASGYQPFWSYWMRHGYIFASADMRGTGASFGTRTGEFTEDDSLDAAEIIEWMASQPWSNGRVGMVGVSANGISQFVAAGAAPPALRAIIPMMAMFDMYDFVYPGGIYRYEFLDSWGRSVQRRDRFVTPVPVDADTDGALAQAAVAEHQANINVSLASAGAPFRDSRLEGPGLPAYADWTTHRYAPGINRSNVAVYQVAGWYDIYPRDQALWTANLSVPQRIMFTPFSHSSGFSDSWRRMIDPLVEDAFTQLEVFTLFLAEFHRFFDYHLKDIHNGIMDEPPIWYYVMGAPRGQAWQTADRWPPPESASARYYFQAGPSGSIDSVNDGLLTAEAPPGEMESPSGTDSYTADYATTMGTTTRWHDGHGDGFFYGDMSAQGQRSLTYTTPPLAEAVQVVGHPVVSLWVTASADDADFFVYLEEVDAQGYAHYITEGMLRASHRALHTPPYENFGLPWHRSFAEDVAPLPPGEPVELRFDLQPTANIFDAGHRIRVRVVNADADNHLTPALDPAPIITLYRSPAYPSRIELPVMPLGR